MSTKINIPSWLIQVQTVIIFQTLHVFNTQMIFALIFKNICGHKISKPLLCLWKISSKQYAIWFCPPISIYMFYLFILNGRLTIKINKDTPTHHWPRSKACTFVWIQKVSAQFEQTPICIPRPAPADQLQLASSNSGNRSLRSFTSLCARARAVSAVRAVCRADTLCTP